MSGRHSTESGISIDERITAGGSDFEAGYEAALDLLSQPSRPSAIFALADSMAVGALHAAAHLGIDVPGELSVMGFDNISLAAYVIPPLTTVAQPIAAIGESAVQILLRRLQDRDTPPETVMLNTQLIVRQSTGAYQG